MPYAAFPAFPAQVLGASTVNWRLTANTQVHTSPLDGTTQTLRLPGSRWVVSMSWKTLPEPDWRDLDAFVSYLGGRAGRFTLRPTHAARRGGGGGSPVINGAGQSGGVLSTRGWPASTLVLRAGDFISYPDAGGRPMLHKVVDWTVTSDGSGQASFQIAPPIRRPGADGEAVEVDAPFGLFRLASDTEGDLVLRAPLFASFSLNLEEALV